MARPLAYDDLYRIPFPSDPQLHPDGSRVAFVVTTADREHDELRSRVWVVDVGGASAPEQLTLGDHDTSPRWAPDGRTLAYVGDPSMAAGLLAVPAGAQGMAWSPDGTRLAYVSAIESAVPGDHEPAVSSRVDGSGEAHVFLLDVASGARTQLTTGDFCAADVAWSPDGTRLAFTAAMHDDRDVRPGSSVFVVPADASRSPLQVTPTYAWAQAPVWSLDGATVVYAGAVHTKGGHTRLLAVPADGGDVTELAPGFDRNVMVGGPAYPGGPPQVRRDDTVVFCARDHGSTHVYQVPAAGGDPEKIIGGDARVVAGVHGHGGQVAFVAADADSPGEVWVDERQLTALFATALPEVELIRAEPRWFTAPDGLQLQGWLLRDPNALGAGPLLLDIHGGPHNAWGPAFDGVELHHQVLAAAGWTVLLLNARGSDGYGEGFYNALLGAWGRADQGDFLAAVDALVADGTADPERLAVSGYSYGGYQTCWLTTQTDRFAAAVTGGCVSDLTSFVGTSDAGSRLAAELGCLPFKDPARYADLSPITHVANVRTPTLVVHGQADDRCPVGQAEQWFAALRRLSQATELVRYPGADHLFAVTGRPSHRIDYSRRLAGWVTARADP
jgi:dipeptidyl aminopeptidase/acylaminoacyl peptidase